MSDIVKDSIGDLIFWIETLTSDRDTIKVCVRATAELSSINAELATIKARLTRADELLRAVNKTGGVVVESYKGRYLRDLITEYFQEADGGG